jgi:hypothetical protein
LIRENLFVYNMAEVQNTQEASTKTTLVLDETAGELTPAGFHGIPIMGIMKNLVQGDKRAKVAPLMPEADADAVRDHNGENSVTGWDITITNNQNGASITSTGIAEIGESEDKAAYAGVSYLQVLHHLGGVEDCPLHGKFVKTLIEALRMTAHGESAEDIAQHYEDNKINWAPSTEKKNDLVKRIRKETTKTHGAKTTITRNE